MISDEIEILGMTNTNIKQTLRGEHMPEDKRWMAEILYRDRKVKVVAFEELHELHDIVEFGPNWNLIDTITVTLNRWSGD